MAGASIQTASRPTQTYIRLHFFPGWILSWHLNSTSAAVPLCCAGIVKGPVFYFILEVEHWRCTTAGYLPIQPQIRSLFTSILLQSHRKVLKMKSEIGAFYALGQHLKSGWAVLHEQRRWGELSLQKVAGPETSSLHLVSGRIFFWTLQCFQIKPDSSLGLRNNCSADKQY